MTEARTFSFSLNRKVTVLTLCVLPILLLLGNWQLHRAEEKRQIAEQVETRRHMEPSALEKLALKSDLAFQPVRLRGEFENSRTFLLDNRMHQGRVGYEVLSPFHDNEAGWVLVNRGWLPAPATRDQLPSISPATVNQQGLEVEIYVPPGEPILLEEQKIEKDVWPQVIQAVEMEKLSQALGVNLFPYELRINGEDPAAFIAEWPAINMRPEQHIGYAVQWFAMAAALVIWFVFANTNLWRLIRKTPK